MSSPKGSPKRDGAFSLDEKGDSRPPVYKIVLTGGPCGGKTTATVELSERLTALGWRVFRVPEAASILLAGGMSFYQMTAEQQYQFQLQLLKLMLQLENSFYEIAKSTGQKCIILCDRGAMDVRSYMSEEEWQAMMDENGWTTVGLRDSRYDCVVHLVTAAIGAEKFYTTQGATTRVEAPEIAAAIDGRIKSNWIGHPYFHVVDNSGGNFAQKLARVLERICNFVGVPVAGTLKRKFLVLRAPETLPIKYEEFDVEHDYLVTADDTQSRLRKRGQKGTCTYALTTRYQHLHGQRLELKQPLSGREYMQFKIQKDPLRQTVKKRRVSFLWRDQYYELDIFLHPHPGLMLLESYTNVNDGKKLSLPDFLDIQGEVTSVPQYSMYQLALGEPTPLHRIGSSSKLHDAGVSPLVSRRSLSTSAAAPPASSATVLEALTSESAASSSAAAAAAAAAGEDATATTTTTTGASSVDGGAVGAVHHQLVVSSPLMSAITTSSDASSSDASSDAPDSSPTVPVMMTPTRPGEGLLDLRNVHTK